VFPNHKFRFINSLSASRSLSLSLSLALSLSSRWKQKLFCRAAWFCQIGVVSGLHSLRHAGNNVNRNAACIHAASGRIRSRVRSVRMTTAVDIIVLCLCASDFILRGTSNGAEPFVVHAATMPRLKRSNFSFSRLRYVFTGEFIAPRGSTCSYQKFDRPVAVESSTVRGSSACGLRMRDRKLVRRAVSRCAPVSECRKKSELPRHSEITWNAKNRDRHIVSHVIHKRLASL
jgi:hypothetical protein